MTTTATPLSCPVCGFEMPAPAGPGLVRCVRRTCGVQLHLAAGDLLTVQTFRLADHFSLCVLPFVFGETERGDAVKRLAESPRWKERIYSLDHPDDVDRTEYFLPYIRRFLFPTLFDKPTTAGETKSERTCWQYTFDLTKLGPAQADGLPMTLHGQYSRKAATVAHELMLERIELIVFSYRVGFLVFRVRCRDPRATFFDQMASLGLLRPIMPLYRGFEMPELDTGPSRFGMARLLPFLLQEFDDQHRSYASVPDVPADATLPVKPTYDDRMMVYTFSCLDKETVLEDPAHNQRLLGTASVINFDRKDMARPQGEQYTHDARLWLQSRWQGFSKDGGVLVVFNTDKFHSQYLGTYYGTYYFDIFLLAALQRVTLLSLFEQLSDIKALITGSGHSRQLMRRVRRDLLLFKNQCTFSQITNRERGLVLWKKWQFIFETRTLLREVNQQAEELNNYMQQRYRERMDWLVRLGGFLGTALPAIWGMRLAFGDAPWVDHVRWILMAVLFVGVAVFAWFVVFRPSEED
jgi:hypothetical protein